MADLAPNTEFEFQNVVLITLDSCRFDTFESSAAPNMKGLGKFRRAFTQATYTLPAHIAILTGFLPSTNDMSPFYDRLSRYLFFIRGGSRHVESFVEFPRGTRTISSGFKRLGYRTICISATEWFRHPFLRDEFEFTCDTGINIGKQLDVAQVIFEEEPDSPVFALINIGETHDPYRFGSKIESTSRLATRLRLDPTWMTFDELFEAQVNCCTFIDKILGRLFEWASNQVRDSIFVICGDHGECFGEDGLFGHGFFHPKVMEVPLGIFLLPGKGTSNSHRR